MKIKRVKVIAMALEKRKTAKVARRAKGAVKIQQIYGERN